MGIEEEGERESLLYARREGGMRIGERVERGMREGGGREVGASRDVSKPMGENDEREFRAGGALVRGERGLTA